MTSIFDAIIIGGGIIGSSTCAHLAREGLKVALINWSDSGMPASIAAAGLFQTQLSELENTSLKDFSYKSYEYFLNFYNEIKENFSLKDIDLGFRQCGSLYLIFSILEISQKENELKELKTISPKVSFLNKQDIPKIEPNLTKEALGAFYYPHEGFINNPKFLKALQLYCTEKNAQIINSEVVDINIKNNNIENIVLQNGETLQAKNYVLCNGAWANKLLKKSLNINEKIIHGIKGEILQVGAIHDLPFQKVIFCKEGYILPRIPTNELEKPSILIGSTSEEVDIDENKNVFKNTVSGISSLTNLFQRLFPTCKNYPVLNMWSGVRPCTKDKLPVISKPEEIKNLYLGLGHYRNGILMGPLTGRIVKDLICENTIEYNIEPFKVERFLRSSCPI